MSFFASSFSFIFLNVNNNVSSAISFKSESLINEYVKFIPSSVEYLNIKLKRDTVVSPIPVKISINSLFSLFKTSASTILII